MSEVALSKKALKKMNKLSKSKQIKKALKYSNKHSSETTSSADNSEI